MLPKIIAKTKLYFVFLVKVLQWGDVNLADFAQVPRVKAKFTEVQPR